KLQNQIIQYLSKYIFKRKPMFHCTEKHNLNHCYSIILQSDEKTSCKQNLTNDERAIKFIEEL
uniref:hypothetical protein n=1 Tax=Acinetobacter sp. Res13-Abat-PEC12-P3-01 TaxID=2777951 RepID=UPI001F5BD59A